MRDRGLIDFSGNYEPQMAAPLDGRVRVALKQYLYLPETWASNDGSDYTYKGMAVAVYGDTSSNNGMYILVKDDYTLPDAWINPVATSASGVTVLTISDLSQLDTIDLEQGVYIVNGAAEGHLVVIDKEDRPSMQYKSTNYNTSQYK